MKNPKVFEKVATYTGDVSSIKAAETTTSKMQTAEDNNYAIISDSPYVVQAYPFQVTQNEEIDEEIVRDISRANYGAVMVPALE